MIWNECSPVDERVLLVGEYSKGTQPTSVHDERRTVSVPALKGT